MKFLLIPMFLLVSLSGYSTEKPTKRVKKEKPQISLKKETQKVREESYSMDDYFRLVEEETTKRKN